MFDSWDRIKNSIVVEMSSRDFVFLSFVIQCSDQLFNIRLWFSVFNRLISIKHKTVGVSFGCFEFDSGLLFYLLFFRCPGLL